MKGESEVREKGAREDKWSNWNESVAMRGQEEISVIVRV